MQALSQATTETLQKMIYNMLRDMGYPKEKLLFEKYEDGKHTPTYWRNIFPEF